MRFRIGALVAIALMSGLIAWLVLRDTDDSAASEATSASAEQLETLATSVRHPIFWLGPREDYTYELRREENGSIFIRYLPPEEEVGSDKPHLTVGTYPFPRAFAALRTVAKTSTSGSIDLPRGGLAVPVAGYPSVHVAYPGVDYQVEVFDPTAGTATKHVADGELAFFGNLRTSRASTAVPRAEATSLRDLQSLTRSIGHPIYWLGPRTGVTYELLHSSSGKIYIRYLPRNVNVGAPKPYLTVATYPFPGAFGAVQALADGNNATTIRLARGGLAVVDEGYPNSIHLAFPESDYQVEVFDPSPARALRLVRAGRVRPIG